MRNAALMLGIIGGIWGMITGFVAWGWTEFVFWFNDVAQGDIPLEDPDRLRIAGLLSPVLAILGGAMVRARPLVSGVLMLISAVGMQWGFGFHFFTMFPIAMAGIGGLLALIAGITGEED